MTSRLQKIPRRHFFRAVHHCRRLSSGKARRLLVGRIRSIFISRGPVLAIVGFGKSIRSPAAVWSIFPPWFPDFRRQCPNTISSIGRTTISILSHRRAGACGYAFETLKENGKIVIAAEKLLVSLAPGEMDFVASVAWVAKGLRHEID